jgi:hypothetical protein
MSVPSSIACNRLNLVQRQNYGSVRGPLHWSHSRGFTWHAFPLFMPCFRLTYVHPGHGDVDNVRDNMANEYLKSADTICLGKSRQAPPHSILILRFTVTGIARAKDDRVSAADHSNCSPVPNIRLVQDIHLNLHKQCVDLHTLLMPSLTFSSLQPFPNHFRWTSMFYLTVITKIYYNFPCRSRRNRFYLF